MGAELGDFGFEGGSGLGLGAELGDFVAEAHEFQFVILGEVGGLSGSVGGGLGLAEVGFELLEAGLEGVVLLRGGFGFGPESGGESTCGNEQGQKEPGDFVHSDPLSLRFSIRLGKGGRCFGEFRINRPAANGRRGCG